MPDKVLFISGSIGLGHARRDLEIARELRRQRPGTEIVWLADEPARTLIREAGEAVAPEAALVSYGTRRAEAGAMEYRSNMTMIGVDMMLDAPANAEACRRVIAREGIGTVVGDEAYDLLHALQADRYLLRGARVVFLTDFLGFEPMTENPLERTYVNYANGVWARALGDPDIVARCLFIGARDDVAEAGGPSGPATGRELEGRVEFVGYILSFDPAALADRARVRASLGYGDEPLIVGTAGGTSAGKPLLDLCAHAFPHIRRSLPRARMVLVCGPRIAPEEVEAVEGVEVRGFVPDLYRHLAACDLAVIAAGGTTSLELLALRRPFIYFPLEQHFEQAVHVSRSNRRRGADLRMTFSRTTPAMLARAVADNICRPVDYPSLPLDGARRAAARIIEVMDGA